MTQTEFERNSFGIFKKTLDSYPDNYSRQNGCYKLFNRNIYNTLLTDCLKTNNGAYELTTQEDRTQYFLLALVENPLLDKTYQVFNINILPDHKNEIIKKLLILFMDFQNIHHTRRKNFLKSLG